MLRRVQRTRLEARGRLARLHSASFETRASRAPQDEGGAFGTGSQLFPSSAPSSPPEGYQLLVVAQNLFSITCVFFIALALRNYFRIKWRPLFLSHNIHANFMSRDQAACSSALVTSATPATNFANTRPRRLWADAFSPYLGDVDRRVRARWRESTSMCREKREAARRQPASRTLAPILFALFIAFAGSPVHAQDPHAGSPLYDPLSHPLSTETSIAPLIPQLNEFKQALIDLGYNFQVNYTGEGLGNPVGGAQQSAAYEGLLELGIDGDLNRIAGLKGASFHINAFQIHGHGLTTYNIY